MRKVILDWLLSATAVRVWIQLAAAVGVAILYRRIVHAPGVEYAFYRLLLGLALIVLLTGPVYYFCLPPLLFVACVVLLRFSKETAEYPCPVCGYDIRYTPHRCPECGAACKAADPAGVSPAAGD